MKHNMPGRLPSFQDIRDTLSPIEAVGISHGDMKILTADTGKITVGIPKGLVLPDKYNKEIPLLSYAVRIAENGERQQVENKNRAGESVELNAETMVNFLSAIQDRKIELYPPPTSYENRRLNEAKQSIIDLGISRLSQ